MFVQPTRCSLPTRFSKYKIVSAQVKGLNKAPCPSKLMLNAPVNYNDPMC